MTEPKKQDGTMELDVGQIDLLDLPLPPRSKPGIEAAAPAEEPRGSKGPPPLPPAPPTAAVEEEPPVPSLALPSPSQPHPPPGAVSARSLAFGPPKKQKSPAVQLMIGMGGATVLCVVAFFVWKATHKAQPVAPAPAASASAAPAPTHAFTMAPIEFTAPASSGSAAPEETASAHSATPAPTTTSTGKPTATSRASAPTGTTKPPRTDELIKVEN